jgi:hypothetical protein
MWTFTIWKTILMAYGLNKQEYIEERKAQMKLINEMEENQLKLYAMILQHLSPESIDEIKRHKNYKEFYENTDPEGLWQAV